MPNPEMSAQSNNMTFGHIFDGKYIQVLCIPVPNTSEAYRKEGQSVKFKFKFSVDFFFYA